MFKQTSEYAAHINPVTIVLLSLYSLCHTVDGSESHHHISHAMWTLKIKSLGIAALPNQEMSWNANLENNK